MNTTTKAKSLDQMVSSHPFFKGLNAKLLKQVTACASLQSFPTGQYVFREKDPSNAFYAIRKGKVSVEIRVQGGELPICIQTVSAGEVLGWSWLIPPHQKQFDARVIEPTDAVVFDARCLRAKCAKDTKLGLEMLRRTARLLGQRLQATRLQVLDMYDVPR